MTEAPNCFIILIASCSKYRAHYLHKKLDKVNDISDTVQKNTTVGIYGLGMSDLTTEAVKSINSQITTYAITIK